MEITIDIPKNTIKELISVTDSDNEGDAIKKAIDFTNDRY
jgi:5S rRNA maturation endonuclease (ribonuclease M5)